MSSIADASLIADALAARTPKDLITAETRIWNSKSRQKARKSISGNVFIGRWLRKKIGEPMMAEEEMKQTFEAVQGRDIEGRQEGRELGKKAKSGKNGEQNGVECRGELYVTEIFGWNGS